MTLFYQWMKEEKLTVEQVHKFSTLNKKTITNLRSIENDTKVQLGTLKKLKDGFGDRINIPKVFPTISRVL